MNLLNKSWDKTPLAQVLLFEERWDQVIKVAEGRDAEWDRLADLVADALITKRPEWVIRISQKYADAFIERKKSKYYVRAAEWLARGAKKRMRNCINSKNGIHTLQRSRKNTAATPVAGSLETIMSA